MDSVEHQTHSFIVKIWFEEALAGGGGVLWRGHITHVPSGYRQYIQDLSAIHVFIMPYIHAMGGGAEPAALDGELPDPPRC
jgi:hypothetical protein